jgi:hypothetical protein
MECVLWMNGWIEYCSGVFVRSFTLEQPVGGPLLVLLVLIAIWLVLLMSISLFSVDSKLMFD